VIVTLSSGNLSITQNALNMLEQRARAATIAAPVQRRFDVRRRALDRRFAARGKEPRRPVPHAEQHRLFRELPGRRPDPWRAAQALHVYSEGNFIEATADTCYFQSGETKYASRSSTA
jgi:putative proteasome-type protease